MFSTFLTLIIITMMIFAGCKGIPAKQGLYGTVIMLHGTMKSISSTQYQFTQTSPPTLVTDPVKFDFVFQKGDYHKTTSSNELGNYLITLKPQLYNDNNARFYITSATSAGRPRTGQNSIKQINESAAYVVFIKVSGAADDYQSLSVVPDKGIVPQNWLILQKEQITMTPSLYLIDEANVNINTNTIIE
jgi:hypothetical protein